MPRNDETKPKDAGLLVMLLLVVVGTLIMAWVTDHKPQAGVPTQAVEARSEGQAEAR